MIRLATEQSNEDEVPISAQRQNPSDPSFDVINEETTTIYSSQWEFRRSAQLYKYSSTTVRHSEELIPNTYCLHGVSNG